LDSTGARGGVIETAQKILARSAGLGMAEFE